MALNITITDAGRAEIINANNTGTAPVALTHIGFTAAAFTPTAALTALPSEIKRVSSIAGEVVAPDTISVTAKDEGADTYTMRGFGIFTAAGNLFAVYGQADPIIEKSSGSTMLLTIDIILADIEAASLEFGDISFSNPPASQTTPGVVTLNNAVNSTAQNQAATPAAVKTANDNANTRLAKSQNLADLTSADTARVNLGLGLSATLGNTASRTSPSTELLLQAAAMNDHRTSGDHDARYPQRGNNLSDLPSPSQARSNLGLSTAATMGTTASRTSTATDTVLQAKAMNDHRQSGDHDNRYYQKSEFTTTADGPTPVVRDSAGDIRARLFRSTYTHLNANIAVIYTSTNTAGTDFMRPSTPAQVKAALSLSSSDVGLGNLPNSTTASRTSAATNILLQAKAMNDHRQSSDHDNRYYRKSEFQTLKSPNGYRILPDGTIEQWGAVTATIAGAAFNFPIAFTTACWRITPGGANGSVPGAISVSTPTLTGAIAYTNLGAPGCVVHYRVIGI